MLRLGAELPEVAVVDDQRGCPTYVGHLAAATEQIVRLPYGVYHVAAAGDCTWADFAEAIFEEAGLGDARPAHHDRRVRGEGPAAGLLGASLGEGRARAAALARRAARVPGTALRLPAVLREREYTLLWSGREHALGHDVPAQDPPGVDVPCLLLRLVRLSPLQPARPRCRGPVAVAIGTRETLAIAGCWFVFSSLVLAALSSVRAVTDE